MPIVRPLSWMVAAASLAVVVLGTRLLSGRRAAPEKAPDPPPVETPRRAASLAPPSPTFHAPPATRPRTPSTAPAHLRGRVILPAGTEVREGLAVEADDGHNTFEAEIGEEGQFELHLPARSYTLTATMGSLVGVRAGVRARAGATEPVDITLGPGAAIEGTVNFPEGHMCSASHGSCLEVSARRTGGRAEAGSSREEENTERFAIEGLIPGARYDVSVAMDGLRTTVVRGVTAPARIEVALQRQAVLRGAIGFSAGAECPIDEVSLTGEDGRVFAEEPVDRNCQFQIEGLPDEKHLLLRASGGGWHLEERIDLPSEGDPELVCLNPPCRDLPPIPRAKLEVILTGAPERAGMTAMVSQRDDRGTGCGSSGHRCEIAGLEAGRKTTLHVQAGGCDEIDTEIVPAPGPNSLQLACRPLPPAPLVKLSR